MGKSKKFQQKNQDLSPFSSVIFQVREKTKKNWEAEEKILIIFFF